MSITAGDLLLVENSGALRSDLTSESLPFVFKHYKEITSKIHKINVKINSLSVYAVIPSRYIKSHPLLLL